MKKNDTTKIMLLQNRIDILEKQLNKLTAENERLKQEKRNDIIFSQEEYGQVIDELRQIKKEYSKRLNDINTLYEQYKTKMDGLIISIKTGTKGICK